MQLIYTFFAGLTKPVGDARSISWDEFCKEKPKVYKTKEAAPLYSFTSFKDNYRLESNVEQKSAIVLDFENKPNQHRITTVDDVREELKEFSFFAHSSYSNSWELPRFRVVVPLSSPVAHKDWPYVFGGFVSRISHLPGLDLSCKSAARAFFYPATSEENAHIYQSLINFGALLNPEEVEKKLLEIHGEASKHVPGRNNKLVSMITAKLKAETTFEQIVSEIVEFDRTTHATPLFTDASEGYRNGAESGAAKLVLNVAKSLGVNPFQKHTVIEFIPENSTEEEKIKPLSKALLSPPGLVGDLAAHILDTAIKPQPELALAAAFAACGALMGRKIQSEWGNRTNLYFLCLAETGSGKDHARSVIKEGFLHVGIEARIIEDLASEVGLVSSLAIEPSSLMLIDEFGKFLQCTKDSRSSHLYAINRLLLTLYSNSNQIFVGKKYRQSENNITIEEPCLNLMGMTTPKSFFKSINEDSLSDGFLNRFICIKSSNPNPKSQFKPIQKLPPSITERFDAWAKLGYGPSGNLHSVGHMRPAPRTVYFSPEAKALFQDFENQFLWGLREKSGDTAELYQRGNENALKLALILAAGIDIEAPLIDEQCANYAIELIKETTEAFRLLLKDNLSENKLESDKQRIVRFFFSKDKENPKAYISLRDIKRKFRGFTKDYTQIILNDLILEEQIVQKQKPPASTGGRPLSPLYRLYKYGNRD